MKKEFRLAFLICIFNLISSEEEVKVIEGNNTQKPVNETSFFPQEIIENFQEYKVLEEIEGTCNFEKFIKQNSKQTIFDKLKSSACLPDANTFKLILGLGWEDLIKYVVQEVYLPQSIDPTNVLYNFINKNEATSRSLKNLLGDLSRSSTLPFTYTYRNFENSVQFVVKLPDPSYVPEYMSIFCHNDMLKLNCVFKSRSKIYRLVETKFFFDQVEGGCEKSYNYFEHQIEISLYKLNKYKTWDKLFKN